MFPTKDVKMSSKSLVEKQNCSKKLTLQRKYIYIYQMSNQEDGFCQ